MKPDLHHFWESSVGFVLLILAFVSSKQSNHSGVVLLCILELYMRLLPASDTGCHHDCKQ